LTAATIEGDGGPAPEVNPNAGPESLDHVYYTPYTTRSVWYCWTAPHNGFFIFDTQGSPAPYEGDANFGLNHPPILNVYSGSDWTALEGVDSGFREYGDPGPSDYSAVWQEVAVTAEAGRQYLIQVENGTSAVAAVPGRGLVQAQLARAVEPTVARTCLSGRSRGCVLASWAMTGSSRGCLAPGGDDRSGRARAPAVGGLCG
jgi:hypothetical protein